MLEIKFISSDIIIDISYDATEDATTFYFTEDTYEEKTWDGNLQEIFLTNIPLVMF